MWEGDMYWYTNMVLETIGDLVRFVYQPGADILSVENVYFTWLWVWKNDSLSLCRILRFLYKFCGQSLDKGTTILLIFSYDEKSHWSRPTGIATIKQSKVCEGHRSLHKTPYSHLSTMTKRRDTRIHKLRSQKLASREIRRPSTEKTSVSILYNHDNNEQAKPTMSRRKSHTKACSFLFTKRETWSAHPFEAQIGRRIAGRGPETALHASWIKVPEYASSILCHH